MPWKCPADHCGPVIVDPVRVTVAGDSYDRLRCSGTCGQVYPEPMLRWVGQDEDDPWR